MDKCGDLAKANHNPMTKNGIVAKQIRYAVSHSFSGQQVSRENTSPPQTDADKQATMPNIVEKATPEKPTNKRL